MIVTNAFDVEVLPNYFSVAIVDLGHYLETFSDCKNSKGKPIELVKKLSVAEIKERLSKVRKRVYVITDTDNSDLLPLVSALNEMNADYKNGVPTRYDLYGFNSKEYDNLMIAAFLMHFNQFDTTKELCKKLYDISKRIIEMHRSDAFIKDPEIEVIKKYPLPYASLDVMRIFNLHKVGVSKDANGKSRSFGKSLKQTSINLMWYELLEWSIPPIDDRDRHYYMRIPEYREMSNEELTQIINRWDRYIIDDYREEMSHYNVNDVYIVCEMVRMKIDEIKLRYSIAKSYKIDCLSDARSNIADKLVTKFYSEMSGLLPHKFDKLRTERTKIHFNKVIFPHIEFKTQIMKDLLNYMKTQYITHTNSTGGEKIPMKKLTDDITVSDKKGIFKSEVKLFGTTYTIATGGIHSADPPRVLKSKAGEYTYIHWDYASYYPSIMIAFKIAPEHLNREIFVKLVKFLRDTRVEAKHAGDGECVVPGVPNKIAAEALKIVINSIYGKMGFENGYLYDRLAQMQVTINGQLMTMTLVEELELNGIHVVSANTDGIVIKLPNDKRDKFKEITDAWNERNHMGADGEEYEMLVQRDINNYLDVQVDGKVEYKGDMDPEMFVKGLDKGYNAPIVAEAVSNYFIYNIPLMETLTKETNPLKFCKSQNVSDRKWTLYYNHFDGTEWVNDVYQNNTRYLVTTNGGVLKKVDKFDTSKEELLCANQRVTPLNTLTDDTIDTYCIDYKYYYNECFKIINPILLGRSAQGKGKTITRNMGGMYESLFDLDENY